VDAAQVVWLQLRELVEEGDLDFSDPLASAAPQDVRPSPPTPPSKKSRSGGREGLSEADAGENEPVVEFDLAYWIDGQNADRIAAAEFINATSSIKTAAEALAAIALAWAELGRAPALETERLDALLLRWRWTPSHKNASFYRKQDLHTLRDAKKAVLSKQLVPPRDDDYSLLVEWMRRMNSALRPRKRSVQVQTDPVTPEAPPAPAPTSCAAAQTTDEAKGGLSFAYNDASHHIWLTDEGAARLRHIQTRLRLSDRSLPLGRRSAAAAVADGLGAPRGEAGRRRQVLFIEAFSRLGGRRFAYDRRLE